MKKIIIEEYIDKYGNIMTENNNKIIIKSKNNKNLICFLSLELYNNIKECGGIGINTYDDILDFNKNSIEIINQDFYIKTEYIEIKGIGNSLSQKKYKTIIGLNYTDKMFILECNNFEIQNFEKGLINFNSEETEYQINLYDNLHLFNINKEYIFNINDLFTIYNGNVINLDKRKDLESLEQKKKEMENKIKYFKNNYKKRNNIINNEDLGFIYILKFEKQDFIKIGKTINLKNRIYKLSKDFGNISKEESIIIEVNNSILSSVEHSLHKIFLEYNLERISNNKIDGDTELFLSDILNNNYLQNVIESLEKTYTLSNKKFNIKELI